MRVFAALWIKECKDFFVSPIAYLVIGIFLLVTGWFFFSTFFIKSQAGLRDFFNLLPMTFAFVIPALTMRLFAEELNLGSYEILITMPVSHTEVVLSKFFAGLLVVAAMLLPTLVYVLFVALLGEVDPGPVIGGYLGSLLLGAAYTAIGLLTSALTKNQIIAYILGTLLCFTLTLINQLLFFVPEAGLHIAQYLGAVHHFQNIAKGIIDSRDIIYFLSIVCIGLYLTTLVIQEKT